MEKDGTRDLGAGAGVGGAATGCDAAARADEQSRARRAPGV